MPSQSLCFGRFSSFVPTAQRWWIDVGVWQDTRRGLSKRAKALEVRADRFFSGALRRLPAGGRVDLGSSSRTPSDDIRHAGNSTLGSFSRSDRTWQLQRTFECGARVHRQHGTRRIAQLSLRQGRAGCARVRVRAVAALGPALGSARIDERAKFSRRARRRIVFAKWLSLISARGEYSYSRPWRQALSELPSPHFLQPVSVEEDSERHY